MSTTSTTGAGGTIVFHCLVVHVLYYVYYI